MLVIREESGGKQSGSSYPGMEESSNAGALDFTSLHSSETMDSLDSSAYGPAPSEESRGPRLAEGATPPGRTYECESVCRETLRLLAGVIGVATLTFAYATFGGFLFMTVENR